MKYAFIERHRQVWPIRVQCRVLSVSVSGYHEHLRGDDNRAAGALSDEALLMHISAVYAENGEPTVGRASGGSWSGASARQATGATADAAARHSGPWQAPLPGHDHRQPPRSADCAQPSEPQLHPGHTQPGVVGDITYIPSDEGWLFLAVVLDLFSRKVVGWSMRADMDRSW